MNKNTMYGLIACAVVVLGAGAYWVSQNSGDKGGSAFKTQSINQCPELPGVTLGNKNPIFSDGSDLSSLFGTTNEYLLIDVSKTNCAACTTLGNAMNQDSEIQKLLGPESTCGFLSVAATSDLNARKNHIGGFVAANSKGYGSPLGNVRAMLAEFGNKLGLNDPINAVPRYVFMKRDGTFMNEAIFPSHTTIKNIVQQYCTMCPNTGGSNGEECSQDSECESGYCEQTTISKCVSGQYGEKLSCAGFTSEEQCLGFTQPVGTNNSIVSVCKWETTTSGICAIQPPQTPYCKITANPNPAVAGQLVYFTIEGYAPGANFINYGTMRSSNGGGGRDTFGGFPKTIGILIDEGPINFGARIYNSLGTGVSVECEITVPVITPEPFCGNGILDKGEQCDGIGQAQCGKGATCSTTGKAPCTCQYSEVIGPDKLPDTTNSDSDGENEPTERNTQLPTTRVLTK